MNKFLGKYQNKNDTKRIVIYILESECVTLESFHDLTSQTRQFHLRIITNI